MAGETMTVTEYERDVYNLWKHFNNVTKKYNISAQQVMIAFGAFEIKESLKLEGFDKTGGE